jgi:hypothetical protein
MVVFPAKRQTPEQQAQDEGECYAWSKGQTGVDPMAPPPAAAQPAAQPAQSKSTADGSRVRGAARGAAAGAIIGSISGDAGAGAAIGAGSGLLFGTASGANALGYSSWDLQRQYDGAYMQCMYARGNRVPVRAYSGSYGGGYGAPSYSTPVPPTNGATGYPPPTTAPDSIPPPNTPPPRM